MADIITSDFGNTLERIRDTEDLSVALAMLKQVKLLKDALEAADRFKELSTKYAVLNAEALLRVIELGGASKLRGNARYTAEWLATLSAEEVSALPEEGSVAVAAGRPTTSAAPGASFLFSKFVTNHVFFLPSQVNLTAALYPS